MYSFILNTLYFSSHEKWEKMWLSAFINKYFNLIVNCNGLFLKIAYCFQDLFFWEFLFILQFLYSLELIQLPSTGYLHKRLRQPFKKCEILDVTINRNNWYLNIINFYILNHLTSLHFKQCAMWNLFDFLLKADEEINYWKNGKLVGLFNVWGPELLASDRNIRHKISSMRMNKWWL